MIKRKKEPQIYPDEVFMDAENISDFATERFEGRMEKPIGKRTFLILGIFFAAILFIFFVKIFSLQILRGESFASMGENNRLRSELIVPNRGVIYDRNGEKLAWNGPSSRLYADMPGLSHVLGYVGFPSESDLKSDDKILPGSVVGKGAVERAYQSVLAGKPGLKLIETDSQNNIISESSQRLAEKGEDVSLFVDAKIQSRFYKIMESVVAERDFRGGAGALMDINTGEIISLVSYPEYDSLILSRGEPRDKINEFIFSETKPFLNRAISGLYTPGSIIKPMMALAALSEGIISPDKKIFSSGSISLPNPYFPDKRSVFYDWKAHGWVDMRRALAVSSNVYFYEIGGGFGDQPGLGIKKIGEYAKKFGLGEKTGIDIGGEKKGTIPSPEWKLKNSSDSMWRIGDTYNASIGQGAFQVTPIQMAVYAATVANGGKIFKPQLVNSAGKSKAIPEILSLLDIRKEYFQVVREGMRMSATVGTASALNIPFVKIAAKTGTAEVGISKKRVNSWIIGFFPYEKPKFAFSIVLEKGPRDNLVGALYVARQLFDWMTVNAQDYLK